MCIPNVLSLELFINFAHYRCSSYRGEVAPVDTAKAFLHNPTVIPLFALAHFAHHVLTALIVPLLPNIRNEFGLNYAQTGVVSAAFTVAYGVSQLPAGWLSDRVGPRTLLVVGISGVAVVGAFVGLVHSYLAISIVFLLMGIAGGGYHPSASALISSRVSADRRGRALGIHIIGGSTSYFVAPLIAAGLVSLVGWRGSFVSLSIPVFILGAVVFLLLRKHTGAGRKKTPSGNQAGNEQGENQEAGHSIAHIVTFLIFTGIIGALVASTISFIPLLLVDQFDASVELASALLAIIYGSGFWAAPLGGHISDRVGQVKTMAVVGIAFGPVIIGLTFAPNLAMACAAMFALGILMFVRMPTAESYVAHAVPAKMRSTVLGIYFFSGMEGSALLTPILGAIIDARGFEAGFVLLGTSMLIVALICSAVLFKLRKRSDTEPAAFV